MTTNSVCPSLSAKSQEEYFDTKKTRRMWTSEGFPCWLLSELLQAALWADRVTLWLKRCWPYLSNINYVNPSWWLMHKIHLGNFHTRLMISTDIITSNNPWWALKQTQFYFARHIATSAKSYVTSLSSLCTKWCEITLPVQWESSMHFYPTPHTCSVHRQKDNQSEVKTLQNNGSNEKTS